MTRALLPSVECKFQQGLITRFNPHETAGKALLRSDNMDGYGQFLSVGKVPGSTRKSDKAPAGWDSLHSFMYFNQSNVLIREIEGFAAGNFYRINADNSLSELISGLTAEPLAATTVNNRLHLSSPSNAPFKWDGTQITNWGVQPPATAPAPFILGAVGTGSISGTVSYRVTFVTSYGLESNAGPVSVYLTAIAQNIPLGQIPTSSDPQVISRNIYRDNNDAVYQYVGTLNDNTTTTFVDTVSNGARLPQTPPLAADPLLDNAPPPNLYDHIYWHGYVFAIQNSARNKLMISNFGQAEAFPLTNVRTFDEELIGFSEHTTGLHIHARHMTWVVSGTSLSNFYYNKTYPKIGLTSRRSLTRGKDGILAWHDEGPFLLDGVQGWYAAQQIRDLFENIDSRNFANVLCAYDRGRFRLLSILQSTFNGPHDTVLCFGYGRLHSGQIMALGYGINPHELRQGVWSKLVTPYDIRCVEVVERQQDLPELWVGCADGYVYRLQDPSSYNWATASGQTPVNGDLETAWFPLGDSPEAYGEPRYLTLAGSGATSSTWTVIITYATGIDGLVLGTVTFPWTFPAGGFSPTIPLPRLIRAGACKVRLQNFNLNENADFASIRMHFIPRPFRGTRTA